jgi:hypothetical protein
MPPASAAAAIICRSFLPFSPCLHAAYRSAATSGAAAAAALWVTFMDFGYLYFGYILGSKE